MHDYIIPIQTAFLVFPFIAFLFTFPYMLYQYRKFGAIPALRTIIVYSCILYLMSAYFLVILPLPPIDEVAHYTTPTMQLVPFQFIVEWINETHIVWNDIHTYIEIINNPVIYQVLYNILMTLPFGIYLRYYFKRNLLETIAFTFLLSLFFELTQLTGLYGIYPRAYRLFDIDDLIINTLGGLLGYAITPLFSWILPTKEKLDQISYEKGRHVTFTRRMLAFGIDIIIVTILTSLITIPSPLQGIDKFFNVLGMSSAYVCSIVIYFMILLPLWFGKTVGKNTLKLRVVTDENQNVKWYHCLVRYGILYFVILPAPFIVLSLLTHLSGQVLILQLFLLGIITLLMILYISCIFQIFMSVFTGDKLLFYERLSHTKNASTIVIDIDEQSETKEEKNE